MTPVAPAETTTVESTATAIAGAFRRVLELDDLDEHTDFFAAGGDSLLATRVLSAIAREYGVELTFDEFVVDPTPAGLAALIHAAGAAVVVAP